VPGAGSRGFVGFHHADWADDRGARTQYAVAARVTALETAASGHRRHWFVQLLVFAGVGGVFNVLYALLYLALRTAMSAQWANAIALVLSTIAGTWGHRRVTFGVRGTARTVTHQTLGLAMLVFGLVVTAGSLRLLEIGVEEPSRMAELLVLAAANLGVGLVRFAVFRWAMVPQPAPG
jgi:putative flippase GtrA